MINECFSDNLGDQAISKSINSILQSNEIKVSNADYTGNKPSSGQKSSINTCEEKNANIFRTLFRRFEILRLSVWCFRNYGRINKSINNEIDLALIGGGQLILDNPHFPIALFLWTMILKKKGIKICAFAVGCGESFSPLSRFLVEKSLNRMEKIFVRDEMSQTTIKELFGIDSRLVPDVAYSYPTIYKNSGDNERSYDVVGITDYNVYTRYASELEVEVLSENDYINNWISHISHYGLKNIMLISTTNSDIYYSKRLYGRIKNELSNVKVEIRTELCSLEDYCLYLSSARKVLSARMHSLILAEVFGATPLSWVISKKIVAYNNEMKSCSCQEKRIILENELISLVERSL